MKRVLITGETSYIANRFAACLKEKPEEYTAKLLNLRDTSWHKEDLSQYDVVVHTAALVHKKETPENAAQYYTVNRDLTIELAQKSKAEGVSQFLFLSTGSVYGLIEGIITKDTIPHPITNYGKSKLQAEEALIPMHGKDFSVAILRPLMVYGEGCRGNYRILEKLAQIAPVIPDYSNRRSLVSIENLCLQMMKIICASEGGYYFPHDPKDVCTCELIGQIAEAQGKHLRRLKVLNPAVSILLYTAVGKKAFGNLIYENMDKLPFH